MLNKIKVLVLLVVLGLNVVGCVNKDEQEIKELQKRALLLEKEIKIKEL